ncbi:MAG: type II toxin-antitoxin system VapB family antitoxin [Deltaproteobacteria bacterium]|jgi:antitoxin VapB
MGLSIRNPRVEQLAREISAMSGENITRVILHALENQMERLRGCRSYPDIAEEILKISRRCSAIPDRDNRSPDDILGYNQAGVNEPW